MPAGIPQNPTGTALVVVDVSPAAVPHGWRGWDAALQVQQPVPPVTPHSPKTPGSVPQSVRSPRAVPLPPPAEAACAAAAAAAACAAVLPGLPPPAQGYAAIISDAVTVEVILPAAHRGTFTAELRRVIRAACEQHTWATLSVVARCLATSYGVAARSLSKKGMRVAGMVQLNGERLPPTQDRGGGPRFTMMAAELLAEAAAGPELQAREQSELGTQARVLSHGESLQPRQSKALLFGVYWRGETLQPTAILLDAAGRRVASCAPQLPEEREIDAPAPLLERASEPRLAGATDLVVDLFKATLDLPAHVRFVYLCWRLPEGCCFGEDVEQAWCVVRSVPRAEDIAAFRIKSDGVGSEHSAFLGCTLRIHPEGGCVLHYVGHSWSPERTGYGGSAAAISDGTWLGEIAAKAEAHCLVAFAPVPDVWRPGDPGEAMSLGVWRRCHVRGPSGLTDITVAWDDGGTADVARFLLRPPQPRAEEKRRMEAAFNPRPQLPPVELTEHIQMVKDAALRNSDCGADSVIIESVARMRQVHVMITNPRIYPGDIAPPDQRVKKQPGRRGSFTVSPAQVREQTERQVAGELAGIASVTDWFGAFELKLTPGEGTLECAVTAQDQDSFERFLTRISRLTALGRYPVAAKKALRQRVEILVRLPVKVAEELERAWRHGEWPAHVRFCKSGVRRRPDLLASTAREEEEAELAKRCTFGRAVGLCEAHGQARPLALLRRQPPLPGFVCISGSRCLQGLSDSGERVKAPDAQALLQQLQFAAEDLAPTSPAAAKLSPAPCSPERPMMRAVGRLAPFLGVALWPEVSVAHSKLNPSSPPEHSTLPGVPLMPLCASLLVRAEVCYAAEDPQREQSPVGSRRRSRARVEGRKFEVECVTPSESALCGQRSPQSAHVPRALEKPLPDTMTVHARWRLIRIPTESLTSPCTPPASPLKSPAPAHGKGASRRAAPTAAELRSLTSQAAGEGSPGGPGRLADRDRSGEGCEHPLELVDYRGRLRGRRERRFVLTRGQSAHKLRLHLEPYALHPGESYSLLLTVRHLPGPGELFEGAAAAEYRFSVYASKTPARAPVKQPRGFDNAEPEPEGALAIPRMVSELPRQQTAGYGAPGRQHTSGSPAGVGRQISFSPAPARRRSTAAAAAGGRQHSGREAGTAAP
eukprot:TRINITY_DN2731_c1_g1_i1.p1 TRINITY_DN2731_c1_g1~~TRINITY_DN2731_c1_g1_i1.p1  ORF type:complete len:1350 (+),score=391.18 TRINITY_DN2731_c1_g1_i1:574-4050(+)